MNDYRDDLAAAHARIEALEAEKAKAAADRHDTDPDELVPVHADGFDDETLRERLDDVNDANPWFRWSALAVGIAMLVGAAIQWCNQ